MSERLQHTVPIACTPQALFDYVTQPWRWHEWHPGSRSARAAVPRLQVGDEFDEEIALQPLAPWPPTLRRRTRYRVLESEPAVCWEAEGTMRDGWLRLRYEFAARDGGTAFTRILHYGARGASRCLLPLLRPRQAAVSVQALANLQRRFHLPPEHDA